MKGWTTNAVIYHQMQEKSMPSLPPFLPALHRTEFLSGIKKALPVGERLKLSCGHRQNAGASKSILVE